MFTCDVGFIFLIIHNRFDDISEYLVIPADQQDQIASFWLRSNVLKMIFAIRIFILIHHEYCDDCDDKI